jgi:hypothetical protein
MKTRKVKHPGGGFYIINESDFDPDVHSEYVEKPTKAKKPAKAKKVVEDEPAEEPEEIDLPGDVAEPESE